MVHDLSTSSTASRSRSLTSTMATMTLKRSYTAIDGYEEQPAFCFRPRTYPSPTTMRLEPPSYPRAQPLYQPGISKPCTLHPERLVAAASLPQIRVVLDEVLTSSTPLKSFDDDYQLQIDVDTTKITELYLYPRLTKNERDRLTALWHYTRHVKDDPAFLVHLQDILQLAKDLIPCDCILFGIVEKDTCTTTSSSDPALVTWARREVFCSHTIQHSPGEVFSLPDVKSDSRFSASPVVAHVDLASYYAVPLYFDVTLSNGSITKVALGTLCALGFGTPGEPMSAIHQRSLVRFADMIVHDIVTRACCARTAEKHTMSARLAAATKEADPRNVEEIVLRTLRQTFTDTDVSIQHRPNGAVTLDGGACIPYSSFENNLYEDAAYIDRELLDFNHLPDAQRSLGRTLRAIAVKVTSNTTPHSYLVVQTRKLSRVFDEADVAFVYSCSLIVAAVHQNAAMKTMTARANFHSSLSQELRTSMSSLLTSCERLTKDTALLGHSMSAGLGVAGISRPVHQVALLEGAMSSSRVLLSTVNDLLGASVITVSS